MSAVHNEQLVRRFLADWGVDYETARKAIEEYMTDDCLWENSGLPACHGKSEALQSLEAYRNVTGFERLKVDLRHVLASGDFVVTERVDHNLNGAGLEISNVPDPVLGIFEIRGGKVAAWRDYFDPRSFLGLWGPAK